LTDLDWLRSAWNQLQDDFRNGIFKPRNETDIQAHLYHLLFLNRPKNRTVVTEYDAKMNLGRKERTKHIDLAILRKSDSQLRLLIEIKETSAGSSKTDHVAEKIRKDIEKMNATLITKGAPLTRKPVQIFFFRGAGCIDPELDDALTELRTRLWKSRKVRFFWGPRSVAEI